MIRKNLSVLTAQDPEGECKKKKISGVTVLCIPTRRKQWALSEQMLMVTA